MDILENDIIIIGDIILMEVLQRFRKNRDYNITKRILLSLLSSAAIINTPRFAKVPYKD
jgi:hypothetical protein